MQRTAEPTELMNQRAQAEAYAAADFSEPNQLFVRLLRELQRRAPLTGRALDLGCGPADIPLALLQAYPDLHIDALDGAPAMLAQAEARLLEHPELAVRLHLQCETLPCANLPQGVYSALLSNSLLHHLADPNDLWLTLRHCAHDKATILIMDLLRPRTAMAVDSLVETYALDAPEVLREDFRNSLHAAYTVEEIAAQLAANQLSYLRVKPISDRHWAVYGRFRAQS